jgi:bacterioferritin (cytochrome b1)
MADKRLREPITISLEEDKAKVRIAASNSSFKRQVALLRAMQEMREEMDRVWKDFFEKNPDEKEEDIRRWLEERLRSVHEGSAQGSSDHGQTNLSNFRNQ